jgi:hypothetical protein
MMLPPSHPSRELASAGHHNNENDQRRYRTNSADVSHSKRMRTGSISGRLRLLFACFRFITSIYIVFFMFLRYFAIIFLLLLH